MTFVTVFAGKREFEGYMKNNKNISPMNFFACGEIAMTMLIFESEGEMWEQARSKIELAHGTLQFKNAKKQLIEDKPELYHLYKKESKKLKTYSHEWSLSGIERFNTIKGKLKVRH